MSTTVTTYPMVEALLAAEQILGQNRVWRTQNPTQMRFVTEFLDVCRNDEVPEIENIVSWKASVINHFLAEHGFDIRLERLDNNSFGVASVLDLLVSWVQPGISTQLNAKDGQLYPAVRLDEDAVRYFVSSEHRNPIVQLLTQSGDMVYITMMDNPPTGFDMVTRAEEITRSLYPKDEWGDLVMPMVNYDAEIDIAWLKGLETTREATGQRAWVSQAKQQTKLRLNEEGARVESAVAVGITLEMAVMGKPEYRVDQPFMIWFMREGLARPLFVGHMTETDWEDPGDLS